MPLDFAPDVPHTIPGVLVAVTNMAPTLVGYSGVASGIDGGLPALTEDATSVVAIAKLDGSHRKFAGTASAIYEDSGATWTDRSAGGGYAVGNSRWSFAQFGDSTIAANKYANLQSSESGAFAYISGGPKASLVAVSGGFAMLADTNEATYGDQPDRWWCSGLFDISDWTPSQITQCTTGRLVDVPGPIAALEALGSGFAAYKHDGIFVGSYSGYPIVWQWAVVPGGIGCITPHGVISTGNMHYFIGLDNIYQFDGVRPVPIGDKVRDWFFAQVDLNYLHRTIGYYDNVNGQCWWHYVSADKGDDVCNKALIYNIKTGQFGVVERVVNAAGMVPLPGVTYLGLGGLYSTYADIPSWVQYNSSILIPSISVPTWVESDKILYRAAGGHMDSSLETGTYGDDVRWTMIRDVRPRFLEEPDNALLDHAYSNEYGTTFVTGDTGKQLYEGKWDLLASSKWHKFGISFTGDVEITDLIVQASQRGSI
jgi:hypothetical protein